MLRQEVEKEIGTDLDQIASVSRHGFQSQELASLYATAVEISPKTIVEIGAGYGTSSIVLAFVARKFSGKLYSLEYQADKEQVWRSNLQRFGVGQYACFMQGKTPWINWQALPFGEIDYLLIDGTHSFIPILVDFHSWGCRTRVGGRIAFHDYIYAERVQIKGKFVRSPEVKKAIDAIERVYPMRKVAVVETGYGLLVYEKVADPSEPSKEKWW